MIPCPPLPHDPPRTLTPHPAPLALTLALTPSLSPAPLARTPHPSFSRATRRFDEALKLAVLTREAEDINEARNIVIDRPRQVSGDV